MLSFDQWGYLSQEIQAAKLEIHCDLPSLIYIGESIPVEIDFCSVLTYRLNRS
jgi:signal transduction protein with GAF and PtsI domain